MDPIVALKRASQSYEQCLTRVAPDQWDLVSVCEGWSVKDIADHVVGGNRFAVSMLAGATVEDAFVHALEGGFEGDPIALSRESAANQLDAFQQPGALSAVVHHPSGDIEGATFLGFRLGDLVLHGWDIVQSVGGDGRMDDDLVAIVWEAYAKRGDALIAGGGFGEGASGHVASDASLSSRLLDLTGRQPAPSQSV